MVEGKHADALSSSPAAPHGLPHVLQPWTLHAAHQHLSAAKRLPSMPDTWDRLRALHCLCLLCAPGAPLLHRRGSKEDFPSQALRGFLMLERTKDARGSAGGPGRDAQGVKSLACSHRALVVQPRSERLSMPSSCAAVLEGLDVVYKVEKVGSPSGTPAKKVVITNAGELPAGDTA